MSYCAGLNLEFPGELPRPGWEGVVANDDGTWIIGPPPEEYILPKGYVRAYGSLGVGGQHTVQHAGFSAETWDSEVSSYYKFMSDDSEVKFLPYKGKALTALFFNTVLQMEREVA